MRAKNVAIVSSLTLASRVFGLLRDAVIFAALGTSALNGAFLMAFTLPNLFRRLLGEGALTSAMVPVMADALEKKGKATAHELLSQVFTRVMLALLVLVIVGVCILQVVTLIHGLPERWYYAAEIGQWLMPYMLFVCLAAVVSGALNLHHRFFVGAFTPIWLNLCMALGAGIGAFWFKDSPWTIVGFLSIGVLIGGLGQLIFPIIELKKEGWFFKLHWGKSFHLDEVLRLFLPGVAGAAIFQVNILVSRLLAFSLNDAAISLLYLGGRLIELPLGMFTIAVTTVIFPQLARLVAKEENVAVASTYAQGLRLVLAITMPAAIGLIVLSEPIIRVLFEWGAFNASDVAEAVPVLSICAMGIPLYSWAALSTKGCHAFKDTTKPMKAALVAFVLNIVFSLLFMRYAGVRGLALAGVLATFLQSIVLHKALWGKSNAFKGIALLRPILQMMVASAVMGALVFAGKEALDSLLGASKLIDLCLVVALIPTGMGAYGAMLWVLGFEDLETLKELLVKVIKRS